MKSIFLLLLAVSITSASALAQNKVVPLIAEEEIRSMTITGNIHVMIIEDEPGNENVRTEPSMVDKIKISISGDHISIAPSRKAIAGESLYVYVTVNDLSRLELRGDALATSNGVLNSTSLNVVMHERSRIALRSKGELQVKSPQNFQLSRENGYSSLYAIGVGQSNPLAF